MARLVNRFFLAHYTDQDNNNIYIKVTIENKQSNNDVDRAINK